MPLGDFGGAILRWPGDKAEDGGLTVRHDEEKDSEWFSPSGSDFMINCRVDNLDELIAQLTASGVKIPKGSESDETECSRGSSIPMATKVELRELMKRNVKNKK